MNARLMMAVLLLVVLFALEGCVFFVADHDHFHHRHRGHWWRHSSLQEEFQPANYDLLTQKELVIVEMGEKARN